MGSSNSMSKEEIGFAQKSVGELVAACTTGEGKLLLEQTPLLMDKFSAFSDKFLATPRIEMINLKEEAQELVEKTEAAAQAVKNSKEHSGDQFAPARKALDGIVFRAKWMLQQTIDSREKIVKYFDAVPVLNQSTGRFEWQFGRPGISGAYNERTKSVEWYDKEIGSMEATAAVYNPEEGKVEFKVTTLKGVAGVWNPNEKKIEWDTAVKQGAAGVWNPVKGKVEFDNCMGDACPGYFDQDEGKVVWVRKGWCQMSIIYFDGQNYFSNSSYRPAIWG